MKAVTEPRFYRQFNDALIQRNADQVNSLLAEVFATFRWSADDQLKISQFFADRGCDTDPLIAEQTTVDTI